MTAGPDQLHWGVGTHACPGRFFASYVIKIVLAEILMAYNIKLEDDANRRPDDVAIDIRRLPNPMAKVLFKKRTI